ncbi:MAG: TetR/AcrR family transcriptional regulator [Alphaproteobacteria bacterium]
MPKGRGEAREKLLQAAVDVIRAKGYIAATVEELCQRAGVTKGAFFHHFQSKEDLGVDAAAYWSETTDAVFAAAPYQQIADPVDRVLAYVEFRKSLLTGAIAGFTCLVGTMAQEVYDTHPPIRQACADSILNHAGQVERDIAAAMAATGVEIEGGARGLALYTQAVLQGAFVLAKATGDPAVAAGCVDHLHRYLQQLLRPDTTEQAN